MEGSSMIARSFVVLMCVGAALSCRGGTILNSGVSEQEKRIILETHNRLRNTVAMGRVPGQPGAENMREMVWDDELAKTAQAWASQCTFKHDPQRTIARFTMGQNMAIIWSTAPLAEDDGDFPSRIQNWFNEVQKYAFGASWSPKTGHYSQLVWGETSLVGCGFTYYKDSKKYNKLYVCNYGPGGNVVGYNPYEIGKPACNNHGMNPSSKYQGLCSAPGTGAQQNSVSTYQHKQATYTKSAYDTQQQQDDSDYFRTYYKTATRKNNNGHYNWGSRTQNYFKK